MSKKITVASTSVLAFITAPLTFYFTCAFATGIFNKGQGIQKMLMMFLPGLTGLLMPIQLIIGLFLITRLYRRPNAIKRFLKTYSITYIVLGALGIAAALASALLYYKSFIEPAPFVGFIPLMLIWHTLVVVLGILTLAIFRRKIHLAIEDNRGRGVRHGFFTAIYGLIVFYALNRFGAFILSPFYIQWRTFDLTFPFYITLLSLIGLLIQGYLYYFRVYNTSRKKTVGIIVSASLIVIFAGAFIATGIIGYSNPLFLSAVSPAVPFERMLTKPIEFILHSVATLVVAVVVLFLSIRVKKIDYKYNENMARFTSNLKEKVKDTPLENLPVDELKDKIIENKGKVAEMVKEKIATKNSKDVHVSIENDGIKITAEKNSKKIERKISKEDIKKVAKKVVKKATAVKKNAPKKIAIKKASVSKKIAPKKTVTKKKITKTKKK